MAVLLPVNAPFKIMQKFFDPRYSISFKREHLGIDIRASEGSPVYSPVDGTIMEHHNRNDGFSYMFIQQDINKVVHILGHVSKPTVVSPKVYAGQKLGSTICHLDKMYGSHLHWGVKNSKPILTTTWGWGRCPKGTKIEEALAKGWQDPEIFLQVNGAQFI